MTRRALLSMLADVPFVGRHFRERTPERRADFTVMRTSAAVDEPTCYYCHGPIRLGELIPFWGTYTRGPHLACAEARRAWVKRG